ncbi:MAG: hypothetical protein J6U54_24835 [Clostridiales bacterium]|nr:hypothetical protein [Clostridiales bacterium]
MKVYVTVGFTVSKETRPGVWQQDITDRKYYGELSKQVNKWRTGDGVNQDADFSSQLSIVSDPFAVNNFHSIKYVEYLGVKWKVSAVEIMRPRLILTLGGEYIDG